MSKPRNLIIALILVLLGFGLGRLFAPDSQPAPIPEPPPPLSDSAAEADSGAGAAETARRAAVDEEAASDTRAELEAVLARQDPFDRVVGLAELLSGLDESGLPAVTAVLNDAAVRPGGAEIDLLVRFWSRYDPKEATRWSTHAPLAYQAMAIGPAVEAWAVEDPEAAADAALSGTTYQGTANQVAQVALIRGWYKSGKPGLMEFIGELGGETLEGQRALSTLSRAIVELRGADAAIEWVRSIPDEPMKFKLAAHRQLSSEVAMADLPAAIAFCNEVCDGPYGVGVHKRIAQYWASQDGAAALAWLSEAPPGQQRDVAIRVAFDSWNKADQEAAFAWLTERGIDNVEPWMRPAVAIYVRLRSFTDPADALRWTALVPSEVERQILTVRIARRWRQRDEAAAEAWVMNSDLPEELREAARTTDVHAHIPVKREVKPAI